MQGVVIPHNLTAATCCDKGRGIFQLAIPSDLIQVRRKSRRFRLVFLDYWDKPKAPSLTVRRNYIIMISQHKVSIRLHVYQTAVGWGLIVHVYTRNLVTVTPVLRNDML